MIFSYTLKRVLMRGRVSDRLGCPAAVKAHERASCS